MTLFYCIYILCSWFLTILFVVSLTMLLHSPPPSPLISHAGCFTVTLSHNTFQLHVNMRENQIPSLCKHIQPIKLLLSPVFNHLMEVWQIKPGNMRVYSPYRGSGVQSGSHANVFFTCFIIRCWLMLSGSHQLCGSELRSEHFKVPLPFCLSLSGPTSLSLSLSL